MVLFTALDSNEVRMKQKIHPNSTIITQNHQPKLINPRSLTSNVSQSRPVVQVFVPSSSQYGLSPISPKSPNKSTPALQLEAEEREAIAQGNPTKIDNLPSEVQIPLRPSPSSGIGAVSPKLTINPSPSQAEFGAFSPKTFKGTSPSRKLQQVFEAEFAREAKERAANLLDNHTQLERSSGCYWCQSASWSLVSWLLVLLIIIRQRTHRLWSVSDMVVQLDYGRPVICLLLLPLFTPLMAAVSCCCCCSCFIHPYACVQSRCFYCLATANSYCSATAACADHLQQIEGSYYCS